MDISALNAFSGSTATWSASNLPTPRVERNEASSQRSKADGPLSNAEPSKETDERTESSEKTAGPTRPDGTPLAPEEIEAIAAEALLSPILFDDAVDDDGPPGHPQVSY